ncbi:MAG: hypothetical protein ACRDYU_16455, partial [Actinomycetes bacterium]
AAVAVSPVEANGEVVAPPAIAGSTGASAAASAVEAAERRDVRRRVVRAGASSDTEAASPDPEADASSASTGAGEAVARRAVRRRAGFFSASGWGSDSASG